MMTDHTRPDGPEESDRLDPVADAAKLLDRGWSSDRARTRNLANRIRDDLTRLAGYVHGERRIAAAEAELKAARQALSQGHADLAESLDATHGPTDD